ncbi:MAG: hypothetical protein ABR999_10885 [Methanoregula sp.]|jgi:hypothetical protein|uniref:hypothetical protein n=1 Tax=Methanoregula sp. TaxID=2052170 RepID=UPI003D14817E
MIPGLGNILSYLVAGLGILGGLLNISMNTGTRFRSYVIWSAGNGAGSILYYLAYLGILEITIGFLALLAMNLVYTGIDVAGCWNTRGVPA